jgi:hypothetical protein
MKDYVIALLAIGLNAFLWWALNISYHIYADGTFTFKGCLFWMHCSTW